MSLFTTEERVIEISDGGKTYHVTIRKFNEGQRLARKDVAARLMTLGRSDSTVISDLRLWDYETAIVSWDFPDREVSISAIKELEPEVADRIHEHIVGLNPSVFPPEDDEADGPFGIESTD